MSRIAWASLPLVGLTLCNAAATQQPAAEARDPAVQETAPANATDKPAARALVKLATLDAATRAPTKDEIKTFGLKVEVRVQGQVVTDVAAGGAASKAGLAVGDVILTFNKVEVFSQDDIADVLRVRSPGQTIQVAVLRTGNQAEEVLAIALGSKSVAQPEVPALAWDYASLAHLDTALAKAKKEGRLVLVGLSGAET